MSRLRWPVWALLLLAVMGAGCITSRAPHFQSATILPEQLKPGDSAIIEVHVSDHFEIVDRVEGVVTEDQRVKLQLRDDGEAPDEKAGDGKWTLKVDVPIQAPPGEFTIEIYAFDAKGNRILVSGEDGSTGPLMSTCKIVIASL